MPRTPLNHDSTHPIMVRVTPEQRQALQAEADASGMPLGGWMRNMCLAAVGETPLVTQMRRATEKRNELRKAKKL
jgi:hypothetical protein